MIKHVVAFDVDNTLKVGPLAGPIPLKTVEDLFKSGEWVVGICGNFHNLFKNWEDWHFYSSFFGGNEGMGGYKPTFLKDIKYSLQLSLPITDFVMVGNRKQDAGKTVVNGHLVTPHANDDGAAKLAGWRFLSETEFANGKR